MTSLEDRMKVMAMLDEIIDRAMTAAEKELPQQTRETPTGELAAIMKQSIPQLSMVPTQVIALCILKRAAVRA